MRMRRTINNIMSHALKGGTWLVMVLIILILCPLTGCSSDSEEEMEQATVQEPIEVAGVMSYVKWFEENKEEATKANGTYEADEAYGPVTRGITRAWEPPTDPGSGKQYEFFADANAPISVFFAREGDTPKEEFFFYSGGTWRVSKDDLTESTYWLYGYRPHKDYIETILTKQTVDAVVKPYSYGAVLTLNNVNTVMSEDFCVIIGAKNGTNANNDGGITRGDFAYAAEPTETEGKTNYVYLLFDHIYAAMRFRIKVHPDYHALRHIKLKELSLQAYEGSTPIKKKNNVAIKLTTTGGTDPIGDDDITFTPVLSSETGPEAFYTNKDGFALNTEYSDFQAHFMPEGITKVRLISTYDVYDTKDNLVRQNCMAANVIDISELFSGQTDAKRGNRYTIKMTIKPTYLYMLSDPDLDNPSVVVE